MTAPVQTPTVHLAGSQVATSVQAPTSTLAVPTTLCFLNIKRSHVQALKALGYTESEARFSGSSTHGMRTAISKVLQAAVDWNLLEQNPARGICIGDRAPKAERLYLNPREVGRLLASLSEPSVLSC